MLFTKSRYALARLTVFHAAADDKQRLLACLYNIRKVVEFFFDGYGTCNSVDLLFEKVYGIIVALALYVLRKRKRNRSRMCRVEQNSHRVDERAHNLLGTVDSVKISRNRLVCVVGGYHRIVSMLYLLKYGVGLSGRKRVAAQQQKRYVVCRSRACRRNHICRAGTYRRYAGHYLASVVLLCIRSSRLRHSLLVFTLIHLQRMFTHRQSFAYAEYAAVSEYSEYAFDKLLFLAVEFYVLIIQKSDDCLANAHSFRLYHKLLLLIISPSIRIWGLLFSSYPKDCRRDVLSSSSST